VEQAQSWLEAFVAYGVDIFIDEGIRHINVWTKKAGYDSAGLDYLRKAATRKVEAASIPIAIKPALARSKARLAGEAPFGLIPFRIMIPSYFL
jgi:hypothetical protein